MKISSPYKYTLLAELIEINEPESTKNFVQPKIGSNLNKMNQLHFKMNFFKTFYHRHERGLG